MLCSHIGESMIEVNEYDKGVSISAVLFSICNLFLADILFFNMKLVICHALCTYS